MTEVERLVGCERAAPEPLLRALRAIDPTAELLYMGEGAWWLGRMVSSAPIRAAGGRLAESCRRATKDRATLRPEDRRRWTFAQARLLGFQPTSEYVVQGEPTAAIVRDQEVMDFLHRTLTFGETETLADADAVRRKAEAYADLTDDGRARDAYRYAFGRSHAITRLDGPAAPRARAGRTLHRSVA